MKPDGAADTPRGAPNPWLLAALVSGLGFAASLIANWPGHFTPDSLWQLAQGRSGVLNDWHPPVMAWMLGVADRLSPGAAAFVVFDTALFFATLTAMVALRTRVGGLGLLILAAVAASPLVLLYQGLVLKDVLFADAAIGGFAALAWAGRLWDRRIARLALVGLAVALLILATLARQNGLVAAFGGALTLGAMARSRRGAALGATAAAGLIFAGALAAGAALERQGDHRPEGERQVRSLQLYDLAGAAARRPAPLVAAPTVLERFLQGDGARLYDPARMDLLARAPVWDTLLNAPGPAVGAAWRRLVTATPDLYLQVRAEVFAWVFLTPKIERCAPILMGVDPGQPELLRAAGLAARYDAKDEIDDDYVAALLHTPLFSHPAYALLAVGLLALCLRDLRRGGGPELIAVAGLLVSALAFAASFFVIAVACDYRYLYFLDAAALAALAHRAAAWCVRRPGKGGKSVRTPVATV